MDEAVVTDRLAEAREQLARDEAAVTAEADRTDAITARFSENR